MKGSAITGPVGKEAAELWPVCVLCPYALSSFETLLTLFSVLLAIQELSCKIRLRLCFRSGVVNFAIVFLTDEACLDD